MDGPFALSSLLVCFELITKYVSVSRWPARFVTKLSRWLASYPNVVLKLSGSVMVVRSLLAFTTMSVTRLIGS